MLFFFSYVCDFFEQCSNFCVVCQKYYFVVVNWFNCYCVFIDDYDIDVVVLFLMFFLEKRIDRVYCIQVVFLEKIIGCVLMFGLLCIKELVFYKIFGKGMDFVDCVECILIIMVWLFFLCGYCGIEIWKQFNFE